MVRRLSSLLAAVTAMLLLSSCGGESATAPTPIPTPTPTATTTAYHVWGGTGYAQYLGFFTCTFCTEFASNSINNQFGTYGSQFSSTSIRNQFSQYGSQFTTFSACNSFAGTPPRIYDSTGAVFYGELTLNTSRAVLNSALLSRLQLLSWLQLDVCKH